MPFSGLPFLRMEYKDFTIRTLTHLVASLPVTVALPFSVPKSPPLHHALCWTSSKHVRPIYFYMHFLEHSFSFSLPGQRWLGLRNIGVSSFVKSFLNSCRDHCSIYQWYSIMLELFIDTSGMCSCSHDFTQRHTRLGAPHVCSRLFCYSAWFHVLNECYIKERMNKESEENNLSKKRG